MGHRMDGRLFAVRRCRLTYSYRIASGHTHDHLVSWALVPVPIHTAPILLVLVLLVAVNVVLEAGSPEAECTDPPHRSSCIGTSSLADPSRPAPPKTSLIASWLLDLASLNRTTGLSTRTFGA